MAPGHARKILLVAAAGLVVLLLTAALVLPRLIDLNTYHDRAVREAEAVLQRPVRLGDTELSLLPPVGVRIRGVAIGPAVSGGPDLLTVDEASVRLKVLPLLLRRDVVLDSIVLREPSVVLRRLADGRWDLPEIGVAEKPPETGPAAPGAAPPVAGQPQAPSARPTAVAIDRLRIESGNVRFIDTSGAGKEPIQTEIEGLDLTASFRAREGSWSASARGSIARLAVEIPDLLSIEDGSLVLEGAFSAAGEEMEADLTSFRFAYDGGSSLAGSASLRGHAGSVRAEIEIEASGPRSSPPQPLALGCPHWKGCSDRRKSNWVCRRVRS